MSSLHQLNPSVIYKRKGDKLILTFIDDSNNRIYEFTGPVEEAFDKARFLGHFHYDDFFVAVQFQELQEGDFKKFWDFCLEDKIIIPVP